jgi:hypothetical protein
VDEFEYCGICSEFGDAKEEPLYDVTIRDGKHSLLCQVYRSILGHGREGTVYRYGITTWKGTHRIDIMCPVPE